MSSKTTDDLFMTRALQLAKWGGVFVAPNPLVGAVIVHEDKIIGEGYHEKYGEAHAEVNAVRSVKNKELLSASTLYVTLEPCSHFGKTPPCADLIVRHQFKRVVVACIDTFSEVAGKGIERLRNAGIEVELGVLEKEAQFLNRRFFTFHAKNRPYIILKWAQTKDGYMDKNRGVNEKGINWITQPETKNLVHKWRGEEQAILVGVNTVNTDDPSLTMRDFKIGKNPIRIVLDPSNKIHQSAKLLKDGKSTIIFNEGKNAQRQVGLIQYISIESFTLDNILQKIYNQGISSIIIEGGKYTLEQFIAEDLWDETRVLQGDVSFYSGLKAPLLDQKNKKTTTYGKDTYHLIFNT